MAISELPTESLATTASWPGTERSNGTKPEFVSAYVPPVMMLPVTMRDSVATTMKAEPSKLTDAPEWALLLPKSNGIGSELCIAAGPYNRLLMSCSGLSPEALHTTRQSCVPALSQARATEL